jgi:hypothetical protein
MLVRYRWPSLAVRVATSLLLILAFPFSAVAVDSLVQSRADSWMERTGEFMCVIAGQAVWVPAALGLIVGATVLRLRARLVHRAAT